MRYFISIVLFLLLAVAACAEESLAERIARIEQNNSGILTMLARQKADIANIEGKLDELTAKVDALAKAQGVQVKASAPDWAGARTFSAQSSVQTSAPAMMSVGSYGAGASSGSAPRRGLFGGRLRGGACAGGG